MTPLSFFGNYQSIIVYDAREHRIWIVGLLYRGSADPAQQGSTAGQGPTQNEYDFTPIPSRPAEDVLRDIRRWYVELQEVPGGENSGEEWNRDIDVASLYREHGWPDHFDGDAFQTGQYRRLGASKAKYFAEEPLRVVKKFKGWTERGRRERKRYQQAVQCAKTAEEEWLAKLALWKEEQILARNKEALKQAEHKSARLCPEGICQKEEDLPIWEFERLQYQTKEARVNIERNTQWAYQSRENPAREKRFKAAVEVAEKELGINERALQVSRSDMERLCPGKTRQSVLGIEAIGSWDVR